MSCDDTDIVRLILRFWWGNWFLDVGQTVSPMIMQLVGFEHTHMYTSRTKTL